MKHVLLVVGILILNSSALAQEVSAPHWSVSQVARLEAWLSSAADEGLGAVSPHATAVEAALRTGDPDGIDAAATDAAIELLEALRHGCCNASLRTGWHIGQDKAWPDARATVSAAVAAEGIDALFGQARPSHPFYAALREAYAREGDSGRRAALAANLDRWRWMPRNLGRRYLLVNSAAFEASLWNDGQMIGRWKVVVGKTRSPTPIFTAQVTGVILNPWWEIPRDIAKEDIAALVRDHPARAAAKGYVREGDRYRQRPGPSNALGRMKLVMPNGFNVYLHDTPSQGLFAQDRRAYSHGCVRVGDALGLVSALLAPRGDWDRNRIEAEVTSGRTQSVPLTLPIPVYVTYFTAEPDGLGNIRYFPDIYHRDLGARAPSDDGRCERGSWPGSW